MLSPKIKFALKILGFIGICILIGLGLYFLMFKRAPIIVQEQPTDGNEIKGGLTTSEIVDKRGSSDTDEDNMLIPAQDLKPGQIATATLTSSKIISPTITSSNEIAFYDPNDGAFYTIDAAGNIQSLSTDRFPKAETVVFSDGADEAVIEFPDGSNIMYDFSTGMQYTLPSHWTDFSFSQDGSSLVTKSVSGVANNDQLVITNADGSVAQSIAFLGNNEPLITTSWSPSGNVVAFSETGTAQSAFGRQEIYLLDANGDAISALIVDGANFEAIWSPSGNDILYSVANVNSNNYPALWYTDIKGQSRRSLNVQTWVDKCTFKDSAMVICAVPKQAAVGSGYNHELTSSPDDVYQINVTTGKSSYIGTPAFDSQMFNLKLSSDGSLLYFTDKYGRLNSMPL
ncbi:hypothetical protein KJ766_02015 [Patescibacteria group bacterium]|nr:hypothetical protein [Patescibacteria group bacterium]